MGDANGVQYNAAARVFGVDNSFTHLMCYYHVLAKVVEKLKPLPRQLSDAVVRDVYDMHSTSSADEFNNVRAAVQVRWEANPTLKGFGSYFTRVWLNPRFCRWQCYHTTSGFATTTNPVEQFNRALKRDYTMRRLLKMGELLQHLRTCCRQRVIDVRPFALKPAPSKELLTRARALQRQQLLRENPVSRMGIDFLLGSDANVVNVQYTLPARVYNSATNKFHESIEVSAQVGTNMARMEAENKPHAGWPVDVEYRTCPCRYFVKYASCVHILFALQLRSIQDVNGNQVLFNRRRTPTTHPGAVGPAPTATGRPRKAGPALSRE